ncbi:MAG: S9 family peptidase [Saprospirales bacterium]|nr:S9 family peptidase [Saprospirales bacterium]
MHNIVQADYPAMLLLTGDKDDRVFPAHSYKFAAAMQAQQKRTKPVLLRINRDFGGGVNLSTERKIELGADRMSFLFFHLKQPVVYDLDKS